MLYTHFEPYITTVTFQFFVNFYQNQINIKSERRINLALAKRRWLVVRIKKTCNAICHIDGRLQRGGFLPDDGLSFADLAADADRRLFRSLVSNPSHVLSRHLPAIKTTNYNLRPRAHGFTLPE